MFCNKIGDSKPNKDISHFSKKVAKLIESDKNLFQIFHFIKTKYFILKKWGRL